MRYQHALRLAGVGGLLSLAALALSAVPSGATLVCPPGATDPSYCTNVLPVAITDNESNVGPTFARLNGVSGPNVDNGDITSYVFQYGRSKRYGNETNGGQVGPRARRDVSQRVGFLRPCTKYHFRIVSDNPDGHVNGDDNTFTTTFLSPISSVDSPAKVRHNQRFTVTVNLKTRADVTISLRRNGRTVRQFNEGSSDGSVSERIKAPGARGTYDVRAVASLDCGSQTSDNPLTVN
jgi:hypothetical protein